VREEVWPPREALAVDLDLASRETEGIDGQHGRRNSLHAFSRYIRRVFQRLLERTVVRRLPVPAGQPVVAVGGATLGGSGKTPLAIACAVELARAGARVALVGHAYRASPGAARIVRPDDALVEVGDEALVAARALEGCGGQVVVAPSRAGAIQLASRVADVLVIDGVAQTAPVRAALALLAVDAAQPWGRRAALPPRGELRAPRALLVEACDAVVGVGEVRDPADAAFFEVRGRNMWPARVESRGAWVDGGTLLTWEALRGARVGLLAALGRPERVLRGLQQRGVEPRALVRARDHGPFGPRARRDAAVAMREHAIDLWLATPKCVLHASRGLPGLPVAVLDHALVLPAGLRNRLRGLASRAALTLPAP
jgi:tetraacyldisaccharide 4'-kinase